MSGDNFDKIPLDKIIAKAKERTGSNPQEGTTSNNDGNRYHPGLNNPQEGRKPNVLDHDR